ncbi:MAG: hypothetical protein PHI35_02240 [Victivallaceae bacterium]|nr:hypothetical protein [Victivallaceae bacterium]
MHWIDWLIVVVPFLVVLGLAVYARRYARGVADFLAAGRVAGRYVISVGDLTAALSVITLVAGAEQSYQVGFGVGFWNNIMAPIGIVLALTGYCTYRWRETRCLSKGQFIEIRYGSKSFRVVTAAVSTISEMVTNAIGPAVAANFFIYYLGLPHRIMIFGIGLPCYAIIVTLCLVCALLIIWPAGRISLLVTDCFQGLLTYPIFVIIVGFIILNFSWDVDISPILNSRAPEQSFINPYDVAQLRDFNIFALIVSVFSGVMNRASWIGNDTTNSGRTPHEQKMAGILGSWRNGFAYIMISLIGIIVIVFMNSGNFSSKGESNRFNVTNNQIRNTLSHKVLDEVLENNDAMRKRLNDKINAVPDVHYRPGVDEPLSATNKLENPYFETVRQELGDSPEGRYQYQKFRTLYQQMLMPEVLRSIFPVGLLGLFCLLMVMLLISTDDSRIFNAAGCLVQDVFLPFLHHRISPKAHLLLLRLTSLGVTLLFFVIALFFSQMDYINMFTTIMCALWLGGAGPIMVFGLYSRFGNLTGAWCAIIFGSGTSLLGLIFQRNWALSIYPWLESNSLVAPCDGALRMLCAPFEPWIHWEMNPVKFPINSYEIFMISMILAISTYIIGSYLTYKPFDLDKLLHRGKYSDGHETKPEPWTPSTILRKLVSITPEYTLGDKIIAWSVFFYSFVYAFCLAFGAVAICNIFYPWPREWWDTYFYTVSLVVPGIVGCISTVWFLIGGIVDMRRLFRDLALRQEDKTDNGQVDVTDAGVNQ